MVLALPVHAAAGGVVGFELTPEAQRSLVRLEEQWDQWTAAIEGQEYKRASTVFEGLSGSIRDLGMSAVPDLAVAAEALAIRAARQGQFDKATAALAAAERLDPGRPEHLFASARLARLEGRPFAAALLHVRGWLRLASWRAERRIALTNISLWLMVSAQIACALFVVLQLSVKGGGLLQDARRLFTHLGAPGLGLAAGLTVLLLPALLPPQPIWAILVGSVLIWGYCTLSERIVLASLWLLWGASPFLLDHGRQGVQEELSPPLRAVENLRRGRLHGEFFSDIGTLNGLLPDRVEVTHLLADLHRTLGQWDAARAHYGRVLTAEPSNTGALLNIGSYYFLRGDYGSAVSYYKRATQAAPDSPAAWFDLSQAYYQQYLFPEAQQALDRASALDLAQVTVWSNASAGQRLQVDGSGLSRGDAIRDDLAGLLRGEDHGPGGWQRRGRWISLAATLVLVALALTLHVARRPYGYTEPGLDELLSRSHGERAWRELLPGLAAAEAGEGVLAWLDLWVPTALLLIPLGRTLAFDLPLGFDPGGGLLWALGLGGLVIYLLPRLVRLLLRLRGGRVLEAS
ncbi:MAG TPA: tetratricopeptide repeat protein [Thermoanaerobaculia bacterium]|nr:tetratricopeptide repeat protein [Thermoanaerobaculia bacterium]